MIKQLGQLVKLQKIDNQLIEITKLKGDLPRIVKNLQGEIDTISKKLEVDKTRITTIILETKESELNIEETKTKLKRYEDQLYLVTSNKEYDALTAEIDTSKQNISKDEYRILELDEEKKNLDEEVKKADLDILEKGSQLKEKKKDLDQKTTETESVVEELTKEKNDIQESIPLRYIREYTRIAKARNGVAIVPVHQIFIEKKDKKGNIEYIPAQASCGACQKNVPPQKLMEIKKQSKLIRCEFCGRLLFWDDKASEIYPSDEEIIM